MTLNELLALADKLEAEFNVALKVYKQASADYRRSKSAKRIEAFVAATEAFEAIAKACRDNQDAIERAARVERRAAWHEARASEGVQASLF